MNPKEIMHRWSGYLQTLLSHTHLYQVLALAAFSFSAAQARHCHLSRLSAGVPGRVQPASTLRRLKRLLHNPRLDVEAVCDQMAAWLGRFNFPGAHLVLLLDETPHHNSWRVVKVSVAFRRRTLPLVWRTDALAGRPHRQRVRQVLSHSARLLQHFCPQAQVTLLADRGLCWPELIDWCQQNGWHFVLRAQGHTRFMPEGTGTGTGTGTGNGNGAVQLRDLVRGPGQWFCGRGRAFAKAGWREVSVTAVWSAKAKEKWLLVSDLPPSLHRVRWYARRMWHEQSFRDEKSHGFCWHESHLTTPQAVHRLLLLLALAQLWLTLLGQCALSPALRGPLGLTSRSARKRYSILRHGWMFLQWCLQNALRPPCHLHFKPN